MNHAYDRARFSIWILITGCHAPVAKNRNSLNKNAACNKTRRRKMLRNTIEF